MLVITARITAHEGQEDALKVKLEALIKACTHHEGLWYYSVHQHKDKAGEFIFYEHFADEAAFKAHMASPELTALDALPKELIREVHIDPWTRLAITGSKSLSAVDALATRRSMRTFTTTPVEDATIERIITAGMQAPSAGNAQPWEFAILRSETSKQKIVSNHPYAQMAAHAPASVLVCGNLHKEKYPGFWVQDCAAAIQNMLLAARALNIGTVWCGIHPMEDRVLAFRQAFAIPDHIIPLGLVVMGYTEQPFVERTVFDAKKIHHEGF